MKVTHELIAEDDGELILVTKTRLGHVSEVDPSLIPESEWDFYLEELAADADAQRAAAGVEAAADAAFNDRFGSFGGRRAVG